MLSQTAAFHLFLWVIVFRCIYETHLLWECGGNEGYGVHEYSEERFDFGGVDAHCSIGMMGMAVYT